MTPVNEIPKKVYTQFTNTELDKIEGDLTDLLLKHGADIVVEPFIGQNGCIEARAKIVKVVKAVDTNETNSTNTVDTTDNSVTS